MKEIQINPCYRLTLNLLPPMSAVEVIESVSLVCLSVCLVCLSACLSICLSVCLSPRDCLSAQKDFVFKTILDYGRGRCVNAGAFSYEDIKPACIYGSLFTSHLAAQYVSFRILWQPS